MFVIHKRFVVSRWKRNSSFRDKSKSKTVNGINLQASYVTISCESLDQSPIGLLDMITFYGNVNTRAFSTSEP